ncbi:MAG: WD40/YVTN/BNR-like repeat-containing protein [Bacteroidota bacterium]
MKKYTRYLLLFCFSFLLLYSSVEKSFSKNDKPQSDSSKSKDPMASETFNGLKFRSIGPAVTSGRVTSIAVDPTDHSNWYIGAASGGVWKTTNAGTTFLPIFDGEASYSIGTVVVDPVNPLIIWVGSGENNSQRSVSYGDGVYKSEDGGKSWKNLGLKKSEHIGRIVIDPRNDNTVFIASQGPLWGPGGDRGIFKTTDGGKDWKNILVISENTGVSDMVIDPKNPDVMYASSYQRRRHVWTLIDGGPESAIYKTTDAGATWIKLKNGLPTVDMGRIGLAISPVDNKIIYATIEAAQKKGGFFRSTDYGANWEKRNDIIASSPQYYGTIFADPKNPDRVYHMDFLIMVTDDGGKTFSRLGEKSKHVDNHAMWIDPDNTKHYLVGCDGGLYESFDRAQTWNFKSNLPITQFYDVCVDNSLPFYYVYGGTQDNNSLGGPSRTRNSSGIANSDWFVTTGGDGFQSRVDPEDPNIVYSESQYGGLVRYDRRTGEQTSIQPQPGKDEKPLRWNWDSPIIVSPHSHTRLYFAANKLFRSDDRGDSWKAVSGELSREIDRNSLPVMDKVWGVDAVAKNASTSIYGNCVALSESPIKEGVIYVGTDDGLIHITEDGGSTWKTIQKFTGIPENTYVSRILASQNDVNTVYASFDNHKMADFAPYILKSTDAGKSWESIKGNLPANGPVLAIAEDHINPLLLFVGTEFGMYFTVDGGAKWIRLKSGLPTIAVRDITIQKRENDLVIATFGRGFYVLDNYTPLRSVKPDLFENEAAFFPIKDAMMYIEATPLGGGNKGSQGESYFQTSNPQIGAAITYYLKDSYKSKKDIRLEAEKDAEKKKLPIKYPTFDELRAEDEEEAPTVFLTLSDTNGNVIRRLNAPNSKGVNRVTWDMCFPLPMLAPPPPPESDRPPEAGPLVMPGSYRVTLSKRIGGVTTQIAGPQSFTIYVPGQESMSITDRKSLAEFQHQVSQLQRAVNGSAQAANDLKTRIGQIKHALQETPAPIDKLLTDALGIEARVNDILRDFRGDNTLRSRNENTPPTLSERINSVADNGRGSTSRPTQTDRDAYAIVSADLGAEIQKLKTISEVDLPRLEKGMEAAGAPWTPGRIPEWK